MAGFASAQIAHCSREANKVVDVIAKSSVSTSSFWVDDPPLFIIPQLVDDVTAIAY
jgi:hypothetical protein